MVTAEQITALEARVAKVEELLNPNGDQYDKDDKDKQDTKPG